MAGSKKAVKKTVVKKTVTKTSRPKAGSKNLRAKTKTSSSEVAANAVDEQLERYRSMRDFHVTSEPSGKLRKGKPKPEGLPFCIQKHAASHLHYDFRLGWNGVLKSWAAAKGPSYFPGDKRLAVQVEDHPMEYGGFEGIIPAGQYGGGTVMLWDQGTWEPQAGHEDVEKGLRDGSLKFVMHGTKIKGKWALIRMHGKAANERKPNWLLIKEHDDFERGSDDPCVTVEEPDSVVTGRTLEEIAHNEDHVWNSKDTAKGKAWYRQAGKKEVAEETSGNRPLNRLKDNVVTGKKSAMTVSAFESSLQKLPEEIQPQFIPPQLALQSAAPPSGKGWLHELKLDGYRMQARKDGSGVQMLTRKGLDWTDRVRSVANEVAKLAVDKVTLDGEVVVLAENGTTNFADLQASFQDGAENMLTYFCFDLLHMDGRNVRELPLKKRKEMLGNVLDGAGGDLLRVNEHLETNGEKLFHKACELHAEGIVSKRTTGRYSSGRGSDWLKMKCLHEQEFVVGGYTLPSNGTYGVGALMLGYYSAGELIYAGRTGTGFTQKTHKLLREKLEGLTQATRPFEQLPTEAKRGAIWVKPELVAQVRFATWTTDNLVRQAAFLGVREDKSAREVVREEATIAPRPKGVGKESSKSKFSSVKTSASYVTKRPIATKSLVDLKGLSLRLTHPEKILDVESKLTKQMLADYYWSVAEDMLPHIADRPLSLVRCPEGSGKPCFFQKHVNAMLPRGIGSVDVADKNGKIEPYITLSTAEALAGLAQMGVLEIHPWGSRNEDLEHPDRLVFDLDPDEALGWNVLVQAAAEVRKRLKTLGLECFLKTTGGKGLHVVAPIDPQWEWPVLKEFAHAFVNAMEKNKPELYLTKMTKAARKGKIYLDYLRNERGATSVAPFSPRARTGAPVSLPLKWSDLKLPERPVFRVAEFERWKKNLRADPWKAMAGIKQRITSEAMISIGMKLSA